MTYTWKHKYGERGICQDPEIQPITMSLVQWNVDTQAWELQSDWPDNAIDCGLCGDRVEPIESA